MMKHSGARCGVFDPRGDLAVHFYTSVGEMMRGFEKNGYVLMGQLRLHRLIVTAMVFVYVEVGPAVALAFPSTRLAGAIILAIFAAVQLALARSGRRPILRRRAKQAHAGNLSAAFAEAARTLRRQEALRAFVEGERRATALGW